MSFDKIISIPGKSGLFKMVAQMRNGGFVVEGLSDGKRLPVSAMERIIMLKDISVYTIENDMPLEDVFLKMKEHDGISSSVNSKTEPDELKATLKKILPEFDEERVHASDIRKMFSWYSMLKDVIGMEKPAGEAGANDSPSPVTAEEAPAAKAPSKKKSVGEEGSGAKPARKTARKSAGKSE